MCVHVLCVIGVSVSEILNKNFSGKLSRTRCQSKRSCLLVFVLLLLLLGGDKKVPVFGFVFYSLIILHDNDVQCFGLEGTSGRRNISFMTMLITLFNVIHFTNFFPSETR